MEVVPINGPWAPPPASRVKERRLCVRRSHIKRVSTLWARARQAAGSHGELPEANVRVQAGLRAVSMPTPLFQPGLMETAEL